MKLENAKTFGDGLIILTVGTGGISGIANWLGIIEQYATALGLIISVFFGLVGIAFHTINTYFQKQQVNLEKLKAEVEANKADQAKQNQLAIEAIKATQADTRNDVLNSLKAIENAIRG